jgi:hypothetical protein
MKNITSFGTNIGPQFTNERIMQVIQNNRVKLNNLRLWITSNGEALQQFQFLKNTRSLVKTLDSVDILTLEHLFEECVNLLATNAIEFAGSF